MALLPPHLRSLISSASAPSDPSRLSDWASDISMYVSNKWDHWSKMDWERFHQSARLNQDLLEHFVSQGHLTHQASTLHVANKGIGPMFFPVTGQSGLINMPLKNNGDLSSALSASHSKASQWGVLLHEASHQEFLLTDNLFCPSPDHAAANHLSPTDVENINNWCVRENDFVHSSLNENFADVYSMMMLISSVEGEQRQHVINEFQGFKRRRAKESLQAEKDFVIATQELGHIAPATHHHHTSPAIEHMFDRLEEWVDLAPSQMRQKAHQIASDGFVDVINPHRMVNNFPVGLALRDALSPRTWMFSLLKSCASLCHGYVLGSNMHVMENSIPAFLQGQGFASLTKDAINTIKSQFPNARNKALNTPEHSTMLFAYSSVLKKELDQDLPSTKQISDINYQSFYDLLVTPKIAQEFHQLALSSVQKIQDVHNGLVAPFASSPSLPMELMASFSATLARAQSCHDDIKIWEMNSTPDACPRPLHEMLKNPEPVMVEAPVVTSASLKDRLTAKRNVDPVSPSPSLKM